MKVLFNFDEYNAEVKFTYPDYPVWLQKIMACENLTKEEKKSAIKIFHECSAEYKYHYSPAAQDLIEAFHWDSTPQGSQYWGAIAEKLGL